MFSKIKLYWKLYRMNKDIKSLIHERKDFVNMCNDYTNGNYNDLQKMAFRNHFEIILPLFKETKFALYIMLRERRKLKNKLKAS